MLTIATQCAGMYLSLSPFEMIMSESRKAVEITYMQEMTVSMKSESLTTMVAVLLPPVSDGHTCIIELNFLLMVCTLVVQVDHHSIKDTRSGI